ncbi:hypothetical protein C5689_17135 [Methylosinus sporium]|uniref:GtrA/DPMS transmembrane domain-containing protein n=2 Tax=Methylosinus sporium TaxID=428 RepID=A0A2U1SLZ3_METSR|nr:hypothetical protein C5689_17135 [Methylosinus sporium]
MRASDRAARLDDAAQADLRLPCPRKAADPRPRHRPNARHSPQFSRIARRRDHTGLGHARQCMCIPRAVSADPALPMRFPRFILVGGLCALLNNVSVIGFGFVGVHYISATLLAFGPILVIGYVLHSSITFDAAASWPSFARYALTMLANCPLWFASLYILGDLADLPMAIAAPLATILITLWNYNCTRWALSRVRAPLQGLRSTSRG